jgi:transposase
MTSKHKSEDYKLSAVEYYLVGDKSQIDVCKIFKCSPRSLMRWFETYKKEGEIKRENRKTVAYKVHKEHVKFLLDEINKNKTITMTELKHKLKDKFKIELSRFHINRIITDNNITLKITRIRHEPEKRFGKEININQKLKEFYDEIKKHNLKILILLQILPKFIVKPLIIVKINPCIIIVNILSTNLKNKILDFVF